MGRTADVTWDKRKGCWSTSAVGPLLTTATGRNYRRKTFNREIARKDKAQARAWLAGLLAAQEEASRLHPAGVPTVEQVAEFYLEAAERTRRLGGEAMTRAAEHLIRFCDWPGPRDPHRMGVRLPSGLGPDELAGFVADLLAAGRSESYIVDGLVKTVRACFNWAASVPAGAFPGLPLASNPIAGYAPPPKPRRDHRPIRPGQVDAFFAWYWRRMVKLKGLNRRFGKIGGILLLTIRATGARPKELCTATWDDWSLRPDGFGVIRLPWTRWKNGKKTRQDRVIAVPPRTARRIEWIRALPGRHPTAIFVHRRERGTAAGRADTCPAGVPFVPDWATGDTKGLQKWFFRVRNQAIAAGVDVPREFRLYWLRSLFSTEAQRRGLNKAFLAKGMGTSEAMLDRHYTDADLEDILGVARGMAGPAPAR